MGARQGDFGSKQGKKKPYRGRKKLVDRGYCCGVVLITVYI
jgi:hypothetical protein